MLEIILFKIFSNSLFPQPISIVSRSFPFLNPFAERAEFISGV